MEFVSEIKKDNALLWPVIEAGVDRVFNSDLTPVSSAFNLDQTILTEYLCNPGRGIGGSLVLRAAKAYEDDEPSEETLAIAAATEVMNAGILIVDDVADDSAFRKGQPTVHERYVTDNERRHSKNQAMQIGIMTMQLAHVMCEGIYTDVGRTAVDNLHRSAMMVTAGQLLESRVAHDSQCQNAAQVLNVHRLKTGIYSFAGPIRTGLLLAGAPHPEQATLYDIAIKLGIIFQLQDDINGVFGEIDATGKPNSDDIRNGVYTMLFHHVITSASQSDMNRIQDLYGETDITDITVKEYGAIAQKYGADRIVDSLAQEYIAEIRTLVDAMQHTGYNELFVEYIRAILNYLQTKQMSK